MATRDEIVSHLDQLLDIDAFTDYGPNGLQVPGRESVARIATGVSASLELIERALEAGAEMLIAHHGLFWDFHSRALSEAMAARLRLALGADLSILGYHLPLDAHPELGNNAIICRRLGFTGAGGFAAAKGTEIGVHGRAEEPIAAGELIERIEALTGRAPLVQGSGPERIERIGVVSGAGASYIAEAVDLGLDALITGEPAEHAMADAREGGIHFIAAGHYATETFGIRALGEASAERFGVEHVFIDVPNPV